MVALPWLLVAALFVVLVFVHGLYRMGLHDRHNLAQFAFLLMLEPKVYELQRGNFIRLVRHAEARDAASLGTILLFYL